MPILFQQKLDDFPFIASLDELEVLNFELTDGGFPEDLTFLTNVKKLRKLVISECELYGSEWLNRIQADLDYWEYENAALAHFLDVCARGHNPLLPDPQQVGS